MLLETMSRLRNIEIEEEEGEDEEEEGKRTSRIR